jgi:hypothetical protein
MLCSPRPAVSPLAFPLFHLCSFRDVSVSLHFLFFPYQENLQTELGAQTHLYHPKLAAEREYDKFAWIWPKKK